MNSKPLEAVSIQEIHPNSIQPRYTIPHDLTDIFALHPRNIVDIFERWIIEVQLETGQKDFDILPYLHGQSTSRGTQAENDSPDTVSAEAPISTKEIALMKIVDLAARHPPRWLVQSYQPGAARGSLRN